LAIPATWGSINIPEIKVIFALGASDDIQGFIIKETSFMRTYYHVIFPIRMPTIFTKQ
jgi:hypothetical protein